MIGERFKTSLEDRIFYILKYSFYIVLGAIAIVLFGLLFKFLLDTHQEGMNAECIAAFGNNYRYVTRKKDDTDVCSKGDGDLKIVPY